MCVNRTYSRYQRTVIDLLNKQLGDRPFSYEKAQNNHLKVLIEGVIRPIYTGSTPSDIKSGKNFMAEVNREIRKSQEVIEPPNAPIILPAEQQSFHSKHSKLIRNLAKYIRQTRPSLMAKETKITQETQNTEGLLSHRKTLKENLVKNALKARKTDEYITPKEIRFIEEELNKHIEFTLPTLAYYSEQLAEKTDQSTTTAANTRSSTATKLPQKKSQPKTKNQHTEVTSTSRHDKTMLTTETSPHAVSATTDEKRVIESVEKTPFMPFVDELSQNRIEQFKTFSYEQINGLIADLKSAMTLKREEDIQLILQLMKEKSITLDDLQAQC